MFAIQLVLFLFLSSAALVRRAQNEFYKNDGHNPLRGLFQFEGGNIAQGKDSLDSGNIQKVIGILQNNIKQWSFIESQLLEPNVNLGMPEIFIPLKHLTTTLEILGNIFFVQNDLSAAQSHLERACPLMELLPPNLLSDEDFAAAAGEALEDSGLRLLDPTDLTSYLWMGTGTGTGTASGPALGGAQEGNTEGSTRSNTYAAGCYSLLRDVYAKLYYGETNNNVPDSEMGLPTAAAGPEEVSPRSSGHIPSPRGFPTSTTTTLKYSPHQAGYHSCLLPNGKPREFNLKYLLSKRQQTQQMKARALFNRLNTSSSRGSSSTTSASVAAPLGGLRSPAGGNAGAAGAAGAGRSTKVSGAKLSMSGATAGTAFLEKSISAAAAAQLQQEHDQGNDNSEDGMEVGHRRRNHALLLGVDGDGLYDDSGLYEDNSAVDAVNAAANTNTNPNARANVKPRRTSVFSGADEEVEEEAVLSSTATSPLPAAMPAVAVDAEAGANVAGADTRKPSPLRSEVDDNSGHGSGHPDGTSRPRVRGQVPQPQPQPQAQAQLLSQKRTFNFEEKLRDLRSPYEHLRSELELVQDLQHQNNNNNKNKKNNKQSQSNARTSSRVAQAAAAMDEDGADVDGDFDHTDDSAEMAGGAGRRVGLGLGLSASPSVVAGQKRSNKSPQPVVRGFEGSSLNYLNGEDITAPGVSTSIIADDLETLLRKFVQANKRNRKELLLQARKYYDELDINFPNMDYNEYAANMDMGQAYLEVMTKVVQEGSFSFVSTELDNWGIAAAAEAQRAQKQQAGGAKGKGKSAAGASGKDKSATSKESTAPPVQFTMAEKNRLLVLYAFDLMHTNPSDPSDLGLGFNRGIEDNDRGRRGDHFMVDALSDAAASLGLDSALTGLLGFHGEVNDAHKRLFPHHSAPHGNGNGNGHDHSAASLLKESNVLDQLAEQHLRDLLSSSTEGSSGSGNAAGEYFAARAAAKAAAASASQPSAATDASSQTTKAAKNKRRKQRQQQMEGGGEYTREDNSHNNYRPTNSGGGYFSGGGQNGDGAGDIFYDEDMTGGASLRSVPTLGADGDWTLSLFVLFMLLTGAVVYSAYQEAARKKLASGRTRARPVGSVNGGGGQNGAGKKASSSSGGAGSGVMLSGTAVVDFMYAQLNGPAAGSSVSTVEAEKGESDATKSSAAIAAASSNTAASAGSGGNKLSWMFTTSGGSNGSSTGAGVNGAAGSSKAAKKAAAAAAAAAAKDASHHQSDKASENTMVKASSSNVAVSSNNPNGKSKGKKGKDKEKNKDTASANGSTAALSSAPSAPNPTATTSTTAAKTIANSNSSASTAKISASTSSTSLHSATDDSHRSSHRDSDSSSSEDEFLSSHPVSVNHRRVSWAGLIPGATTTTSVDPIPVPRGGFAGDMGIMEQGDWAEARKKGSKRNANTSNGTTSAAGGAEEKTQEHLPQRIALGLKDSPLYRQQPRPYQSQQQHAQVLPGRGVPHAGSVDAASAAAARKPSSATTQVQGLGRAVSAADIAAGLSSAASLPYSRAAAAGGAAVNSQNGGAGNAARSGSKAPTYDLSEAKKMAEQLGGWNVGSSPVAATTSTTSFAAPVSVAKASTSVSAAAAAAPPGLLPLRAINSAHTASASAAVSVPESPRSLPSGGVSPANSAKASQQFGFSQFDLSASSATVSSGSYPVGVSWSTASTTSHPSLASLAASLGATGICSANSSIVSTAGRGSVNSALAAQSAYALSDSGRPEDIGDLNTSNGSTNAYLSDIVSFLDSPAYKPPGSKASAKTAAAAASRSPMSDLYGDPYHRQDGAGLYAATTATATTSTVSAATLDFGSTGGSGGGLGSDYDSLHMDEAGYYHVPSADQQGQGQDHHLNQDHQGELYYQQLYGNQLQYDQQQYRPDESAYFPHSNAQYEHGFQQYSKYHGEEEEGHTFSTPAPAVGNGSTAAAGRERRDHGGLRQVALQQASADFAPSITLEASSLYGLSPDAPSFRPSQLRTATNNTSTGVASNGNSGAALDASMSGINRLSAFSGRYDEALSLPPPPLSLSMSTMSLGSPSLGLFDDSLSLPALLQPSSSSASVSVSGHANANSAQALFSTDDFYDSIMIDSILREAEGDGADE